MYNISLHLCHFSFQIKISYILFLNQLIFVNCLSLMVILELLDKDKIFTCLLTLFLSKVTKLDRDPASGTALQEISFWLNLERALLRIQEKRESMDIALTLDVLKHGKRFHATLSFDTDTGNLSVY